MGGIRNECSVDPYEALQGPLRPLIRIIRPLQENEGLSQAFEGVLHSPAKSQKESHDDQGTLKQVWIPITLLFFPGPHGLPSGSSLGSLDAL